jgi:hypothetical protein
MRKHDMVDQDIQPWAERTRPCPLFSFALVGFDTPANGLDILVVLVLAVSLVIIVRSWASVTTNANAGRIVEKGKHIPDEETISFTQCIVAAS